jgi:hypothetical protein
MKWIDKNRHMLARLAAALSALAVLLAIISKLVGVTIVVTQSSYMSFAIVSILFGIYFRVGGLADTEKK